MSIFNEKDGKKTLPRMIYIKTIIFMWLIFMSAIAIRPFQAALIGVMERIKTEFIEALEDFTGMEIHYSSLRPSFFGTFDIRNLRFMINNDAFFTVSNVRLHFSIRELLSGGNSFLHTVRIDSLALDVDMDRDRETLKHFSSYLNPPSNAAAAIQRVLDFLPSDVDYLVRNCNFSLKDGNKLYQINNLNINITGNDGDVFLAGRFNANTVFEHIFGKSIIINSDIGINIVCSNNPQDSSPFAKTDLILYSFTCSAQNQIRADASFFSSFASRNEAVQTLFTINPARAQLIFEENVLELYPYIPINKYQTGNRNDYLFRLNTLNFDFFTDINLNNFIISDNIVFSEHLGDTIELFRLPLTGNLFFRHENNLMDYSFNLTSNNISNSQSNININVSGNKNHLLIENFNIFSSALGFFKGGFSVFGNIELQQFMPTGNIVFDHFSLTGKESVSTVLAVSNNNEDIRISSSEILFTQTQISDIELFIFPSERDLTFSFSCFLSNHGYVNLEAFYNYNPRELAAYLVLNSISFYDIWGLFNPNTKSENINNLVLNNFLSNSYFDTEIFFSTDFDNFLFSAPNIIFDLDGLTGTLSASGTNSLITLSDGVFIVDQNEFLISANLNHRNPNEFLFSVNASFAGLSWNTEGQIFDRNTLIIHDPNGLNIYYNLSNDNSASGFFEGVDFPVFLNVFNQGTRIVYLNFFINLYYNSKENWNVNINNFSVRDRNSPIGMDLIKISGQANQNGASIEEILYTDFIGILTGKAEFLWSNNFSNIGLVLNISDERESGENYTLIGNIRNESINMQVFINNMHINRFFNDRVTMLLSADANLSWDSINSFNANANISSFRTRVQNSHIDASLNIGINNEELLVSNLNLLVADLKTILPEFRINLSEGKINTVANLDGLLFQKDFKGSININANFNQTGTWLDYQNAINNFDGTLRIENIHYNNANQDPFLFVFSGSDGFLSLTGGIRDMIRLNMDNEGNFFAGLSAPFPIRGSVAGTFKNGFIDANTNNFYFDLESLWSIVNRSQDFNISAGYLTGNIDIRGPLFNPEFFGNARGSSLRLQVPEFIGDDLRPVPFNIIAEGYELTFGPVIVSVGSGSAIANGWFVFENWRPVNIGLDVSVPRNRPVPYNMNIAGFLANGTASGNINMFFDFLDIKDPMMEMTGDLFTTNAVLGVDMDEIIMNFEIEDPFTDMPIHSALDFRVTLGSAVEFLWPNLATPLLRANPEMGTVVYISMDSRAGQYSVNSDVRIRSGELYYFDRSFHIRQGNIVFRENETNFDPKFSARAEIRDRSDTGQVTISMIVENQSLHDFVPRFESSPSLTQLELYSILGHNVNIHSDENADIRFLINSTAEIITQVVATSDIFTQFVFFRQFERQVRNLLGLDMFTIRSRFLQNAFVTGATGGFAQTFEENEDIRGNRVGNYFDNTTVFIGKYIGQDMFIQGMLRMKYDENSVYFGGLRLEPDIGIELQSPFVNIRWAFFPYHPENWWVNDNSITLSWSRSF